MWNILIVLIIAAIVWFFNPLLHFNFNAPKSTLNKNTKNEVNQVIDQTQQQIDYARQMQQPQDNNKN